MLVQYNMYGLEKLASTLGYHFSRQEGVFLSILPSNFAKIYKYTIIRMGGNASKPANSGSGGNQGSNQAAASGVRFANGTAPNNGSTAQHGMRPSTGYAAAAAEAKAAKNAAMASPNNQRSWRPLRSEAARVAGERIAGNQGTGQHPYRGGSRKIRKARRKSRKQRR